MALFQKNVLARYIAAMDAQQIDAAYQQFIAYFHDTERQQNILTCKEEQFQEGFLRELFVNILGYTLNPDPSYNLITEKKDVNDSKKADGAILLNDEVIGIIELKDHKTPDLRVVERQAFGYKNQQPKAKYVIISNFHKLRFYIDNAVEHIEWNLFTLTREEFAELRLCLQYDNISRHLPTTVKNESLSREEQITNKLYKDYIAFKRVLFEDILRRNTTEEGEHSTAEWKILLFKKTQKLLDRLLFIFFAEDRDLLPPNSMREIIKQWRQLIELDEYSPLYSRIKKYFGYMNEGHKGKKYDIFAYNGGLFKPDEVLDNIHIDDELLAEHTLRLSEYDYASEVDVNILGHIFENSLSEIEEVTSQLQNGEAPTVSKRKKDGVFYTPQYITRYIVDNTLGKLCREKRETMGLVEENYYDAQTRQLKTKQRMMDQLTEYRNWLLSLTICDPACGSGAFLNAALQFLINEHRSLDKMEAALTGSAIEFPNVENSILENNLYGVDINEESVEIARLALWLRTAKPFRKLTTLNGNIKCGNSLISDPAIAGDKAFDWQKEFPQVFEKGGFDVIIGNPPYGAKVDKSQINLFVQEYSAWGISNNLNDTYFVFYAACVDKLLKDKGLLGFISPNTWKLIDSGKLFRQKITTENVCIYQIVQHLKPVFADATVDCDTLFLQKGGELGNICIKFAEYQDIVQEHILPIQVLATQEYYNLFLTKKDYALKNVILHHSYLLGEELLIKNGVKPYEKGKGTPAQTAETLREKPYTSEDKKDESFVPLIGGSYFNRYKLLWNNNYWIKYGEWLAAPRDPQTFAAPEKLIFRQTSDSLIGTYIEAGFIMRNNTHIVLNKENSGYNLKYVLACLNSKLLNYYYWTINPEKGEAMAEVKAFHLGLLPLKRISLSDQQPFIALADQMLALNKDLQEKRARFLRRVEDNLGVKITGALETFDTLSFKDFCKELGKQKRKLSLSEQDEWEPYFNQYRADCHNLIQTIQTTDTEIDELVYDLYGLTEDEKEIIRKS